MRKNKLLSLAMITMLASVILTTIGPMNVFAAVSPESPADAISILPSSKVYTSDTECTYNETSFTVELYITNITDCAGYDFWIYYNDTLLEMTGVNIDTDPANPGTSTQIAPDSGDRVDTDVSVDGIVKYGVVWKAAIPTYNGSGVAAEITFKIIYCPSQLLNDPQLNNTVSCALELDETWTKAYDHLGDDILFSAYNDGYYEYTTEGRVPGDPIADFDSSPTFPYVSDTVTLTDTSDAGAPFPTVINAWLWSLTGNGTLTGADDTASTTFHCDGVGEVNVTLTVWNNDGKNDTVTKTIEQKEKIGGLIDLYTSENRFCGQTTTNLGIGIDEPADALSPDVNITLFADVTWNGAPVAHVLVGFEVFDNNNQNVLTRTAETDKNGTARIWFRVPRMNPPEQLFGEWFAYISAKIQEIKYEDTMPFKVGYIIDILSVVTLDVNGTETSFSRGWVTFDGDFMGWNITLKNIMMMPKNYTLVITVYDDCDVPIIKHVETGQLEAESPYCNPTIFSVVIDALDGDRVPHWAYVGVGKVYVNVFTLLPIDCGVPYSPEVSTEIEITWPGA